MLTFFIFLLGVTITCPGIRMTSMNGLSKTAVGNAAELRNKAIDSDGYADGIYNSTLAESEIGVEDLFALFPLTVSNAVLHMAHPRPPELLRV